MLFVNLNKNHDKNFTTMLTIGHMPMFVVKAIVIEIYGQDYGCILCDIPVM